MPTITIDVTSAQATRLADAFGAKLHRDSPSTPATISEVRGSLIEYMKDVVRVYEHDKAVSQIADQPLDIV